MRGEKGENVVGDVEDDNIQGIWNALIERILKNDTYVELFQAAFPGVATEDMGFHHAANAIAAYEIAAFTRLDTPFDRFLGGDMEALTDEELRGAELFYGKAGCSSCHSGALLTDQKITVSVHHNLDQGKLRIQGKILVVHLSPRKTATALHSERHPCEMLNSQPPICILGPS